MREQLELGIRRQFGALQEAFGKLIAQEAVIATPYLSSLHINTSIQNIDMVIQFYYRLYIPLHIGTSITTTS